MNFMALRQSASKITFCNFMVLMIWHASSRAWDLALRGFEYWCFLEETKIIEPWFLTTSAVWALPLSNFASVLILIQFFEGGFQISEVVFSNPLNKDKSIFQIFFSSQKSYLLPLILNLYACVFSFLKHLYEHV